MRDRAFGQYKKRFLPLVAALVFASALLVPVIALRLGPLLGPALFAGWVWLLLDRCVLFGNGWLRRRLERRLRGFGELPASRSGRFVGLAHPCHTDTFSRRVLETDDDVGFLTIDWQGLHYRGDALSFDVPAGRIVGVRRISTWYAPWRRVAVQIAGGEPFDEIILDSRDWGSHHACRVDNERLAKQIQALLLVNDGPRLRRLGDQADDVSEVLQAQSR